MYLYYGICIALYKASRLVHSQHDLVSLEAKEPMSRATYLVRNLKTGEAVQSECFAK